MPGAEHLYQNPTLQHILKDQHQAGKLIGAICAAPAVVLAPLGILEGRTATCYPNDKFTSVLPKYDAKESLLVVEDGHIVSANFNFNCNFSCTSLDDICALQHFTSTSVQYFDASLCLHSCPKIDAKESLLVVKDGHIVSAVFNVVLQVDDLSAAVVHTPLRLPSLPVPCRSSFHSAQCCRSGWGPHKHTFRNHLLYQYSNEDFKYFKFEDHTHRPGVKHPRRHSYNTSNYLMWHL
ncbi:hypothetical protein JKP88DRAFT_202576 [Tribonema minus]|uniref:DJ-1/PfpI domain-containing protein n=1 Tax=Tribonema minus TaxID=303371 RepID=A0A836C933_9STRA|nr:hypothetical protein JKP88DRAFT_202576 [Tribonema minus]